MFGNILFQWEDFLAPLDPLVILMSLILGISMGLAIMKIRPHFSPALLVWHIMGGAVFFIPLSILRAFQESLVWERFLSTFILWAIYATGMAVASIFYKKVIR